MDKCYRNTPRSTVDDHKTTSLGKVTLFDYIAKTLPSVNYHPGGPVYTDELTEFYEEIYERLDEDHFLQIFMHDEELKRLYQSISPSNRKRFHSYMMFLASQDHQTIIDSIESFKFVEEKTLNGNSKSAKKILQNIRRENRKYLDLIFADDIATRPLDIVFEKQMFSEFMRSTLGMERMPEVVDQLHEGAEKFHDCMDHAESAFKNVNTVASDLCDRARGLFDLLEPKVQGIMEPESHLRKVWSQLKVNIVPLSLNVAQIMRAKSKMEVFTALSSIVGLLGFTENVMQKISEKFTSFTKTEGAQKQMSKTSVLFGMLASCLGDYSPSKIITNNSRGLFAAQKEAEAMETMHKLFLEVLEEWGLYETDTSKTLKILKAELVTALKNCSDYEVDMCRCPAKYQKTKYYQQFIKDYKTVENSKVQLTSGIYSSLKDTGFAAEVMQLFTRYNQVKKTIEQARSLQGIRVEPVAIALTGVPGIGKSVLQGAFHNLLTKRYMSRGLDTDPTYEDLDDIKEWTTWSQNTQDDYHQGYCGQEVHLVDDLFQPADDKDHLDWCNMISPNKFPTRQADLASKGTPYISKLIVGSVNQFPTVSKTIKEVVALQRRFVVIECTRNNAPMPRNVDMTFPHLDFTMYNSGVDYVNRAGGGQVNLVDILDMTIESMRIKHDFYNESAGFGQQAKMSKDFVTTYDDLYEEAHLKRNTTGCYFLPEEYNQINRVNTSPEFYRVWRGVKLTFDDGDIPGTPAGSYYIADFLATQAPLYKTTEDVFRLISKYGEEGTWFSTPYAGKVPPGKYALYFRGTGYDYLIDGDSWRRTRSGFGPDDIQESWYEWLKRQWRDITTRPLIFLGRILRNTVEFLEFLAHPANELAKAVMTFLVWLFGDHFLMEFIEILVSVSIRTVWFHIIFDTIIFGSLYLYFSVLALHMKQNTECTTCHDALGLRGAKPGTLGHAVFHQQYCRDHCQRGWLSSTHTEICLNLDNMRKGYLRYKCPNCKDKPCNQQECHHSLPMKESITPEVIEYIEIAEKYVYLDKEDKNLIHPVKEQTKRSKKAEMWNIYNNKAKEMSFEEVILRNFIDGTIDDEDLKRHLLESQEDIDEFEHILGQIKDENLKKKYEDKLKSFVATPEVKIENSDNSKSKTRKRTTLMKEAVTPAVVEDSDTSLRKKKKRIALLREEGKLKNLNVTEEDMDEAMIELLGLEGDNCQKEMAMDPNAMNLHASLMKDCFVRVYAGKPNCEKRTASFLHGTGYKNYVFAPFHITHPGYEYWCVKEKANGEQLVIPLKYVAGKAERDVAVFSCQNYNFPSTLEKHVIETEQVVKYITSLQVGLLYIPSVKSFQLVHLKPVENRVVKFQSAPEETYSRLYEVVGLRIMSDTSNGAQTQNGDCGGHLLLLNPACPRKYVGFHIIGAKFLSYSSMLTKELMFELISKDQPIKELFLSPTSCSTFPTNTTYPVVDVLDLVTEEKVEPYIASTDMIDYIGDLAFTSKPATSTSIIPHVLRGTFEETMKPSALTLDQVEDTSLLEKNTTGYPDLLLTQLVKYAGEDKGNFENDLEDMKEQLIDHFTMVLQEEDLSIMTEEEAFSGVINDPDSMPLDMTTSSGEPWQRVGKSSGKKKNAYVTKELTEDGYRYKIDSSTFHGKLLKDTIARKDSLAKKGIRMLSIWKNCLKDETRPIEKVKYGKTRLFTAAPLETVILARKYFGKFKTAWQRHRMELFHSVGINPVSLDWRELYEYLTSRGDVGMDADFGSFDGKLRADFMTTAGEIVIQTILNVEGGDVTAMRVIWNEFVETFHVSRDEVHLVRHGNPSGNPMTTVVNCIVNLLYHWYCFRKITGHQSLGSFDDEVAFTCFGDDVIFSTNKFSKYQFEAIRQIMINELGQDYTTAAKIRGEVAAKSVSELMFLKRKFVVRAPIVMSPLAVDAIEQQFNWTKISESDIGTVKDQIDEALLEAVQLGPIYYGEFVKKLKQGISRLPMHQRLILGIPVYKYTDNWQTLMRRIDQAALGRTNEHTSERIKMEHATKQVQDPSGRNTCVSSEQSCDYKRYVKQFPNQKELVCKWWCTKCHCFITDPSRHRKCCGARPDCPQCPVCAEFTMELDKHQKIHEPSNIDVMTGLIYLSDTEGIEYDGVHRNEAEKVSSRMFKIRPKGRFVVDGGLANLPIQDYIDSVLDIAIYEADGEEVIIFVTGYDRCCNYDMSATVQYLPAFDHGPKVCEADMAVFERRLLDLGLKVPEKRYAHDEDIKIARKAERMMTLMEEQLANDEEERRTAKRELLKKIEEKITAEEIQDLEGIERYVTEMRLGSKRDQRRAEKEDKFEKQMNDGKKKKTDKAKLAKKAAMIGTRLSLLAFQVANFVDHNTDVFDHQMYSNEENEEIDPEEWEEAFPYLEELSMSIKDKEQEKKIVKPHLPLEHPRITELKRLHPGKPNRDYVLMWRREKMAERWNREERIRADERCVKEMKTYNGVPWDIAKNHLHPVPDYEDTRFYLEEIVRYVEDPILKTFATRALAQWPIEHPRITEFKLLYPLDSWNERVMRFEREKNFEKQAGEEVADPPSTVSEPSKAPVVAKKIVYKPKAKSYTPLYTPDRDFSSDQAIDEEISTTGKNSSRPVSKKMTPSGMREVIHMSNNPISASHVDYNLSVPLPEWGNVWQPLYDSGNKSYQVKFNLRTTTLMNFMQQFQSLAIVRIICKLPLFQSQRFWVSWSPPNKASSENCIGFEWNPSEQSEIHVLMPWASSMHMEKTSNIPYENAFGTLHIKDVTGLVTEEGLPTVAQFQLYACPSDMRLYTPKIVKPPVEVMSTQMFSLGSSKWTCNNTQFLGTTGQINLSNNGLKWPDTTTMICGPVLHLKETSGTKEYAWITGTIGQGVDVQACGGNAWFEKVGGEWTRVETVILNGEYDVMSLNTITGVFENAPTIVGVSSVVDFAKFQDYDTIAKTNNYPQKLHEYTSSSTFEKQMFNKPPSWKKAIYDQHNISLGREPGTSLPKTVKRDVLNAFVLGKTYDEYVRTKDKHEKADISRRRLEYYDEFRRLNNIPENSKLSRGQKKVLNDKVMDEFAQKQIFEYKVNDDSKQAEIDYGAVSDHTQRLDTHWSKIGKGVIANNNAVLVMNVLNPTDTYAYDDRKRHLMMSKTPIVKVAAASNPSTNVLLRITQTQDENAISLEDALQLPGEEWDLKTGPEIVRPYWSSKFSVISDTLTPIDTVDPWPIYLQIHVIAGTIGTTFEVASWYNTSTVQYHHFIGYGNQAFENTVFEKQSGETEVTKMTEIKQDKEEDAVVANTEQRWNFLATLTLGSTDGDVSSIAGIKIDTAILGPWPYLHARRYDRWRGCPKIKAIVTNDMRVNGSIHVCQSNIIPTTISKPESYIAFNSHAVSGAQGTAIEFPIQWRKMEPWMRMNSDDNLGYLIFALPIYTTTIQGKFNISLYVDVSDVTYSLANDPATAPALTSLTIVKNSSV